MLHDLIYDAIKKQLPAEVGNALQAELAELERLRQEWPKCMQRTEELTKKLQVVGELNVLLDGKLKAHEELTKREAAVKERELRQELRDLEVKLAEARRNDLMGVVQAVFRSPVYREFISENGSVPSPQGGSYGVTSVTSNKSVERKVE